MEDKRKEQIEALEVLKEYNPKVVKSLGEIIPELKGDMKEDTKEYVNHILKGVNWELQVINGTLELLNEKEEQVSKTFLNEIIAKINDAYVGKDDLKLALALEEGLLPFVKQLEGYIEKTLG